MLLYVALKRNMNTSHEQTQGTRHTNGPIWSLGLRTGAIFVSLSLVLFAVDFVPVAPSTTAADTSKEDTAMLDVPVTLLDAAPESYTPVSIEIESIELETPIIAPASTDIEVLDRALLSGAVHYPESAKLGDTGNMLLFGHSSYLPIVHNKAFQAFNDLSKLEPGDTITVSSATHRHVYQVKQVRLVEAGDAQVAFASDVPMLTLATCNTFGAKQDRWVVTAVWVGKVPLDTTATASQ